MQVNLVLIVVLILGIMVNNTSLILSGAVLLGARVFKLDNLLVLIDDYSIKIGIILIMLGVLTPLARGQLQLKGLTKTLLNPLPILGLIMGVAVTQFTREGLGLMESSPTVTINLVIGVILGVAFFNGVPSGPLIASGITAVIYQLFKLF